MKNNHLKKLIKDRNHNINFGSAKDLRAIFYVLLNAIVKPEFYSMSTMFSKITYIKNLMNLSDEEFQAFFVASDFVEDKKIELDEKNRNALIFSIYKMLALFEEVNQDDLEIAWKNWKKIAIISSSFIDRRLIIKGLITHIDRDNFKIHFIEKYTGEKLVALMNVVQVNEIFNASFLHLDERIPLPVLCHFFHNKFNETDVFTPTVIVLDPDYLVDVTAIANCFTPSQIVPLTFLVNQLTPRSTSHYLLLGHIANAILDKFMMGETIETEDIIDEMFHQFSLEFALLDDDAIRLIHNETKLMIPRLFKDIQSLCKNNQDHISYIEPAFISERFGLQGRLDIFFMNEKYYTGKIVELKSGKTYRTNEHGLNRNHYIQTLLYDLIIKDAFGHDFLSYNYILYSKLEKNRLRQAPTVDHLQYLALKVRNDIVAIIHHLMNPKFGQGLLFSFGHKSLRQAGGFIQRDANYLGSVIEKLSNLEKKHLQIFVQLILGENYAGKVGGEQNSGRLSYASLWNSIPDEKEKEFNIYRRLKIVYQVDNDVYSFQVDEENKLTNFRRGDIVVLYPSSRENQPTRGQLLRGSLISTSNTEVVIRLRNPLLRKEVFESIEWWNVEHDFIEATYRNNLRSLFSFYRQEEHCKNIFMGITPPEARKEEVPFDMLQGLSDIQSHLLLEMIQAGEYYLLWGPPGTGKTSVMLARYIKYIMECTEESILLIAYTNRAVDEICEVLDESYCDQYVRVGSRYSVKAKFRDKLLQNQLADKNSRKAVRIFIEQCRIFVGTVSSISGKKELFDLKKFDRMIVDEASQILEPQLIGLASQIDRNVFIGDHKQLSAVVASQANQTNICLEDLNKIGYTSTSMSMFERLFRRCRAMKWNHAFGRLIHQGRMHQDICNFVSRIFYEEKLKIIEHDFSIKSKLIRPLTDYYLRIPMYRGRQLNHRIEFINTKTEEEAKYEIIKMSLSEAQAVVDILLDLGDKLPEESTVGVICPFRAQIALIRQLIDEQKHQVLENLVIDTVERFQGSAKDVIILSTCSINMRTFQAIHSIDAEGKDRKLNVAISRAREQVIILGNRNILSRHDAYSLLPGFQVD